MKKNDFLNKNFYAVVAITFIALLLRLYKLGDWSFHVDEVATVYHTNAFPANLTINPIIYILLKLWVKVFGISEFSMRLIPCLIGVITIPLFYFPMKKMFNARTSLFSCILICFSPWHLFWSQFARYYTLVFLLGGSAAFCFYFALEKNSLKLLIFSIILAILTVLSHTPSLLIFPTMLLYMTLLWILPVEKPEGLNKRNFIILLSVIVTPAIIFFIPGFFSYLISGWTIQTWGGGSIYVLISLIYRLGIPTTIVALLSQLYLLKKKERPGLFLMSFIAFPLIIVIIGSAFANVAAYYLFYIASLYFLLAGYGAKTIFRSQRKILGLAVILVLLFSFIGEDFLYFRYRNGGRAKWREAFQTISKSEVSDSFVVAPDITAEYYLKREDIISHRYLHVASNYDESLEKKRWLIPDQIFIDKNVPKNYYSGNKPVWFVIYRQSIRTKADWELYKWIMRNCQLVAEYPVFYIGPKDETIKVFLYNLTLVD